MKEELNNALQLLATDLVTKLQNGIDSGTAFVSGQAPILVHEISMKGIATSAFWVCVFLFVLIALVILTKCLWKHAEDYDEKATIIGCDFFIGGASVIGLFLNAFNLVMRIVAPRLYIIEQLKNLF